MQKRKYCKCGKGFYSDTSEVKCPDCLRLRNAKEKVHDKKYFPNEEIQFMLKPTKSFESFQRGHNLKMSGNFEMNDKKNWVIRIYLFQFNVLDPDLIGEIVRTLSHEILHASVMLLEDFDVSRKLDTSGLLNRLTKEGYLGD